MSTDLSRIDPHTIDGTDLETLRHLIVSLMNRVETLEAVLGRQQAEIEHLKAENARLKGEQGPPHVKANTKQTASPNRPTRVERRPTWGVRHMKERYER